jgi:SAM-dependent methyltransferase
MSLENIAIPSVNFDQRLEYTNVFSDVFGDHTVEKWHEIMLESLKKSTINGVEFPTFPPIELQNRIHGHDSEASVGEAGDFYRFACDHNLAGPTAQWFRTGALLDFGSGWGRILRHFMRDFPLRQIVGYEPSGVFAAVARTHNPFVSFLSGGYRPTGVLPASWFDLSVSWSVYSHLSEAAATAWLIETARFLKPGGAALYTTWGLRFLERLKLDAEQMALGNEVHWYSQVCLQGAGDINRRIEDYEAGKFVWFDSLQNSDYGEAFVSRAALQSVLDANDLPLTIEVFDTATLQQDAFILRKT